ncbi:hypothetical protein C3L33_08864, partial [Rhododendron williamsianum]
MASSSAMLVSLALLLITTLFISPSVAQQHAQLKKICSKTFNSDWCVKLMKKDSRTSNADDRGLAEVAIDLAYSTAQDIQNQLNAKLYKDADEPELKDELVACTKNYNDVLQDLKRTKKHFKDGYIQRIAAEAEDVVEEVNECDDQLEGQSSSQGTKRIRKMNDAVELLCDVIKVCASDSGDDH